MDLLGLKRLSAKELRDEVQKMNHLTYVEIAKRIGLTAKALSKITESNELKIKALLIYEFFIVPRPGTAVGRISEDTMTSIKSHLEAALKEIEKVDKKKILESEDPADEIVKELSGDSGDKMKRKK